ncbi:MbtH family NRPS accessory protein [Streptomyces sp. NPDC006475]|uniref:MbtH family protein n=1 Tax=Streptomyces sp. NPDC006475 TaxID=3155719 RepID=UPI0033AA64B6
MSNLLDDPQGSFLVVVNGEGQHALWPESLPGPAGWAAVHGPADRAACIEYVTAHWTDMRPLSLVAHMEGTHLSGQEPADDL